MLQSQRVKIVLTFLVILAFYAVNHISGWWLLRFWNVRGVMDFQDMNAVLYNTDCFKTIGWAIYDTQSGNACVNYVYGSFLIRALDLFNLGSSQLALIGWLAMALISLIFADMSVKLLERSQIVFFAGLLLIVSPPVLLLVERGNFDWIVFLCIYLGAVCFSKDFRIAGFLILCFSALVKFYTFPLLILSLLFMKDRKQRYAAFLIICAVLVRIILDLMELRSIYIGAWFAAFGNTVWAKYIVRLDINLGVIASTLLGLVVTSILMILVRKTFRYDLIEIKHLKKLSQIDYFALFSSITFLACYFAGMNYDYRLIFLIPALWFLVEKTTLVHNRIVIGLFVLAFAFSYNVGYMQPFGDIAINTLVAILLLSKLHLAKRLWLENFRGSNAI
jgi:hypothetical protein